MKSPFFQKTSELLKEIYRLLESKTPKFTELKELSLNDYDGKINLQYKAEAPERSLDITFETEKQAIEYLKSV